MLSYVATKTVSNPRIVPQSHSTINSRIHTRSIVCFLLKYYWRLSIPRLFLQFVSALSNFSSSHLYYISFCSMALLQIILRVELKSSARYRKLQLRTKCHTKINGNAVLSLYVAKIIN